MNKNLQEQEVTATLAATEAATVVHIFQRSGTANYYLRYTPPVAARAAFNHCCDIWVTTGTSDKKAAENIAMRILVGLQDEAELYTSKFVPWLLNQANSLSMDERSKLALRVSTDYEWEEFKINYRKEKDTLALQYSLLGLPLPDD